MRRVILAMLAGLIATSAFVTSVDAQEVRRYVRYQDGDRIWWGLVDGQQVRQLSAAPYLGGGPTGRIVQRASVTLKAPIDPPNAYMTALNFRSHISGEPATYPGLFIVPNTSFVGPDEPLIHPVDSNNFHYEAEAIVVIGRECENVSVEDAHTCVFGLTAGNDGSARDWQGADIQWTRAKGTKGFNAAGPELVTGLDYGNVMITGRLNGEVVQGESTSDMLFNFDQMVSYISRYFTLKPGDVIWSGTMGTTRRMQVGDVYEVEISGVGVLRNPLIMGH
ncbi:MAG TPA: fumarylacetoacetate hydrolase family protein [Longimicrobiaceae bacterium]|nr:fumarylacetoacetate hydrolase family protein [Longimicrobiaceae bacterium]